ncbi:PREDICTED: uncharacterized protein LOC104819473 isoform X2 [Tarenaya hassleriana]|uniref:uncharacterized protein LOC104819473 isoform X2 n=1 Tax=Tarenaya hassleriana TaxID=28532 RepID=UPI00053C7BA4|nr:PREDICTED: uncharacterized protein LOC104819473 isoform X2 [Tarenaya hassleriana]
MPQFDAETPPPPTGKIASGESSPSSSAETTFRELDEVFLQTQTKIWLGEVLQTRLNEHQNIAEMLSDGELLFEVSRAIWEMVLTRRTELGHLKPFKYDPFASRRHSGRYTPYCNVDSFLKVCKILGLSGIDVFSPSDVVEQKNTRKVCMCIRLLSMKARSKCLNVPDFDIVTRTASMPTDMVGFIRRSLELSQGSLSESVTNKSPHSVSTTKSRQRHSLANSVSSENINDSDINVADTNCEGYQQELPDGKCRGENGYGQNGLEPGSTNLDSICRSVSEEDCWDSTTPKQSCIPHQFGMSHPTNYENGEDEAEGVTGSCASNSCSFDTHEMSVSENGNRGKSHDEYLELSSVSSANSVVGPLRLDFRDEHDVSDSYEDVQLSGTARLIAELPDELNTDSELGGGDSVTCDGFQTPSDVVLVKERKMAPDLLVDDSNSLHEQKTTSWCIGVGVNQGADDECIDDEGSGFDPKPFTNMSSTGSDHRHEENTKLGKSNEINQCPNDQDDLPSFKPADKPQKRQILKFVVRGTAILSVMLLALRFRKGGGGEVEESPRSLPRENGRRQSTRISNLPAQNRRIKGVGKGVYPAEKLNLGRKDT